MNKVNRIGKIERDNKLLFIIFILSNLLLFLVLLIVNQIFELQFFYFQKIMLGFGLSLIFYFFLKVTVLIRNGVIYFKNIFGFTLKRITLKDVKSKKVIYSAAPNKSFLFLFGSKYDRMIEIKLDIENSKKYSINGQIFTKKGLEKFIKLLN